MALNFTHDPQRSSWVASANDHPDFPLQNLPLGVFRRQSEDASSWRIGVAIGAQILDLHAAVDSRVFSDQGIQALEALDSCRADSLNTLMSLSPAHWSALRAALSRVLETGSSAAPKLAQCLVSQAEARMRVPARIGDYTDMYTSIHHASNIGKLFRPDNPLTPNFQWVPIGYHGRVSSIDVSGQSFARPQGQRMPPGASAPVFGPSQRMDYELELGLWIGSGNTLGEPLALDEAAQSIFGLCLLNDWSSRDIQAWEYQPLGPFLGKNFATTISPWIVTWEALEPYRVPWTRPGDHPQPLPYLESAANRQSGGLDIRIEAWLYTQQMRETLSEAHRLSHSTFAHAYWSAAQMVAHHTVNGCNLQPGDLIGTGTQSGPTPTEAAALIEITQGGKTPITLHNGETRAFLEDGDTVILKAWCERQGAARIGFGECAGTLMSPRSSLNAP